VLCGGCGSVIYPKSEGKVYDQNYYGRGYQGILMHLVDRFSFWDRYKTLGLKKTEKILEIGFGEGKFLKELSDRGFEVYGLELSLYARENMEKVLGKRRVYKNVGQIDEKFDVVLMYHVLEHIDDPRKYVEELACVLSPNGRLVVRVPNVNSWEAELAKRQWYHVDSPNHMTLFSDEGLVKMLKLAGFDSLKIRRNFGEYRQVMGYSILSYFGIRLPRILMIIYQIVTIPILWIVLHLVAQHGVVEVEGRVGSSNSSRVASKSDDRLR
jgi:SAM-dependent methyltransferase